MRRKRIDTLSPTEAGLIIGKCPQFIRVGLQQQRLPFRNSSTKSKRKMDIPHSKSKSLWIYGNRTKSKLERSDYKWYGQY